MLTWRSISVTTMSTAVQVEPDTEARSTGVGRCKCPFWFAVGHIILGVTAMLVGTFAGIFIHDLFLYLGAIIIFLSLIWWVFWYVGNIDVPPGELEDDVGLIKRKNGGLSEAVRTVSQRIRDSFRRNRPSSQQKPTESNGPLTTDVPLSTNNNA